MKSTRKERTKQDILTATKKIIHNLGHEAVTVRKLAEETGYSHTNLYYYFSDLNHLLWDIRLEMIEEMIEELTDNSTDNLPPVEEMIQEFIRYADYFIDHPTIFRFFYFYNFVQPEGDDGFQKLELKFQQIWMTSFTRLVKEGLVEPQDIETCAKSIIYTVQGLLLLSLQSQKSKLEIHQELAASIQYLLKQKPIWRDD
jgi:AcrR family transcriptional regulator